MRTTPTQECPFLGQTMDGRSAMSRAQTLAAVTAGRILPVIVLEDKASAAPLADALVAGGLRCAEVTFRTAAAEAALKIMANDERLLVGAGTVVTPGQVDRAVDAGAKFIVSPGFSADVVRRCAALGVPAFPGVATSTEIMAALSEGIEVVKFFPAEQLGGLTMLAALAAPFTTVKFIPTGGITAAHVPAYLAHPRVLAIGGSWMVNPKLIAAGDWAAITRLTAEAVDVAATQTVGKD
jgi:2-dehydro-3-deoxyphosphogluconate aldolase/(4S)-4-hydroxy-2-oxoglutarate aldolase